MVKSAAILFGLVFLVVGILGFVPAATPVTDGMPMLLGIFHVNAAHNVVHLASGIVFLLCGMAGAGASRAFFKIFGIVYAIVAIWGFVAGNGNTLFVVSNNPAVTWLHVVLALAMLFLGFGTRDTATA
jgi:Domain of unknown function (DUF4383)